MQRHCIDKSMKQVRGFGSRLKAANDVGGGLASKLKKGTNHTGSESNSDGNATEEEDPTTATVVTDDEGGAEKGDDNIIIRSKFRNRIQQIQQFGTGIRTATDAVTGGAGNVVQRLAIKKREEGDGVGSVEEEGNDKDDSAEESMIEEQKKYSMPPDKVLEKMTIIAKQKMKGVSIQDYYEVAWSEGNDCDKEPIYAPFLTSCGKNNVKVEKWESSQEGGYTGEWCGEHYELQRIVTFNFMKQTIGQTLVSVQHTQRCHRIDNDRFILHMTIKMQGFPYADCFVVEVRHVASRVGENDIEVEIGLYVRFIKSCLFEGKIRKNTTAETTKLQTDLLGLIAEGCKPYAKVIAGGEEEEDEVEEQGVREAHYLDEEELDDAAESKDIICDIPLIRFIITLGAKIFLWPFIKLDLFDPFPPTTVDEALTNVRRRVALLEKISGNGMTEEQKDQVAKEMKAIQVSLKNIEAISSAASTEA